MKWPLSILFLMVVAFDARGQDAPELQRLQSSYNSAIQRAERPITLSYIQELSRLRDSYLATHRAGEAQQVENEIKLMTDKLALIDKAAPPGFGAPRPLANSPGGTPARSVTDARMATPTASVEGHRNVVSDTRATIPANSADAYALGPLRKGDVVTLQYLDGLWKSFGNVGSDNPDAVAPDRRHGDDSRMVIARASSNGNPGGVVAMVPPLTAKTPFTFSVPEDRNDLVLRINKPHDRNPGKVTYQVKITR